MFNINHAFSQLSCRIFPVAGIMSPCFVFSLLCYSASILLPLLSSPFPMELLNNKVYCRNHGCGIVGSYLYSVSLAPPIALVTPATNRNKLMLKVIVICIRLH